MHALQVRDLVFGMKMALPDVEKLSKAQAWQIIRGDIVEPNADIIAVNDDGMPLNPFMNMADEDDADDNDGEAKN
jgi:hypothetical protein